MLHLFKYAFAIFILGVGFLFAAQEPIDTNSKAPLTLTKIILVNQNISLTYNKTVRLEKVFTDAYLYTRKDIYSLGIALISPTKQALVDAKKDKILNQLKALNTSEANNLIAQLSPLTYAYREKIETDLNKIRLISRSNPILKGEYHLLLPTRPKHITVFSSDYNKPIRLPLHTNYHLKDYLSELPAPVKSNTEQANNKKPSYHSAWVIQANQDLYQALDIQWERNLYFLSPGAYVFTGLTKLPNEYHHLNADIANLLTYYLEL